jgi:solute:Na+ symporter, SSS family
MDTSNETSFSSVLSLLDWAILIFVFIATLYAIFYGNRKRNKDKDSLLDYLIMGRSLTLPLFVGTLVATWYGGIFGVTKIAFEKGLYNFLTQGIFWYVAYILFAFFIVDKIAPYRAVTLPELVGKMFGPKSSNIAALFTFFNVVPISYVISFGLLSQIIFGGSLLTGMIIGTLVVCFYSMWGGFRAVVFSDLIQFFVMCLSVFLVIVFSYFNFGGIGFLRQNIPESHFSLLGDQSIWTAFVWGFIALSTLVDPNFYQRCFAAKNVKVARRGILVSTVIWCAFDLCTTFGALYARAVMPEANSKHAYLFYAIDILPHGLKGFFIAGILATILSTLDSYLFIAANTLSYDFFKKKVKNTIYLNHLSLFLVGALAIILGVYFEGDIRSVWKTLGSYSAACLLIPMVFGYMFPGKINDSMFVLSSLLGVIGITYSRFAIKVGFLSRIDDFYVGLAMSILGLFIGNFLFRKTKKDI